MYQRKVWCVNDNSIKVQLLTIGSHSLKHTRAADRSPHTTQSRTSLTPRYQPITRSCDQLVQLCWVVCRADGNGNTSVLVRRLSSLANGCPMHSCHVQWTVVLLRSQWTLLPVPPALPTTGHWDGLMEELTRKGHLELGQHSFFPSSPP